MVTIRPQRPGGPTPHDPASGPAGTDATGAASVREWQAHPNPQTMSEPSSPVEPSSPALRTRRARRDAAARAGEPSGIAAQGAAAQAGPMPRVAAGEASGVAGSASGTTATSPGGGQPPSRSGLRVLVGRRRIGPIPVVLLVGLQLGIVGAYLLWRRDSLVGVGLGGLLLLAGLLLLVPTGGVSLGGRLARRLGYALRGHVGAGAAARSRVRAARDHDGHAFGVVEAAPSVSAVVRITPRRDLALVTGGAAVVPVRAVLDRAVDAGLPIDSAVTIHRTDPSVGLDEVLLVLRLDPNSPGPAIDIRGGGVTGVDACLAALVSMAIHEAHRAGLEARALAPDDLAGEVATALAGGDRDATRWTESWDELSTGATAHRSLHLLALAPGGHWAPAPGPEPLTVATRFAPRGSTVRVRALARVSGTHAGEVEARTKAVSAKDRIGGRVRPTLGWERTAYLETTVLGSDAAPAEVSTGPALDGWFALPREAADRFAPRVRRAGARFATTAAGEPVALDVVGGTPRRVLLAADGLTTAAVVAELAGAGVEIAVATDRPAPWVALARQPALGGRLRTVPATVGSPGATGSPGAAPDLLVVEGELCAADAFRPTPSLLVLRPSLEHVAPEVAATCSTVLLSATTLSSPARVAALTGVAEGVVRTLSAHPQDLVVAQEGTVVLARLGSAHPASRGV